MGVWECKILCGCVGVWVCGCRVCSAGTPIHPYTHTSILPHSHTPILPHSRPLTPLPPSGIILRCLGGWLSGRAPRSHRGGHWFESSTAHVALSNTATFTLNLTAIVWCLAAL